MNAKELLLALVYNDRPKKADAIILLEGDGLNRVPEAVRLYKQKMAPCIVISGASHNPAYGSFVPSRLIGVLKKSHIPMRAIIVESVSKNTKEQAEEVCTLSIQNKWKKILLVGSHYHQPRAFLTFVKKFAAMPNSPRVINAPAADLDWFIQNPWGRRSDLFGIELKKIAAYQKKGDVASYQEGIRYFQNA